MSYCKECGTNKNIAAMHDVLDIEVTKLYGELSTAQLEISRLRLQAEKADKVIGAIQQIAATYGEINRGTLASTIKHSGYEALLYSSKPTGGE